MPRFDFLKRVAVSQLTLPVAVAIALSLWLLLPVADASLIQCVAAAVPAGVTVWLVRELNVRVILLRINSKMLSSVFAVLMGFAVPLHTSPVANVLALALVLIYMLLFTTYQSPNPVSVLQGFVIVSLLTMAVPSTVVLVPFCWLALAFMRSMTLRTILASLFGFLLPYWCVVGVLYALGDTGAIVDGFVRMTDIQLFDYSTLTIAKVLFLAYVMVILLVGFAEMQASDYADKVRVRTLYQLVSLNGFIAFVVLLMQPQLYDEMVALIVVDAAIMGGHYVAQNYKLATHIFFLVTFVLGFALALINALMII